MRSHATRLVLTCSLLVAAIICYFTGFTPGLGFFLVFAIGLEMVFWSAVIRPWQKRRPPDLE